MQDYIKLLGEAIDLIKLIADAIMATPAISADGFDAKAAALEKERDAKIKATLDRIKAAVQ